MWYKFVPKSLKNETVNFYHKSKAIALLFAEIWQKENMEQICAKEFEKQNCQFLSKSKAIALLFAKIWQRENMEQICAKKFEKQNCQFSWKKEGYSLAFCQNLTERKYGTILCQKIWKTKL